MTPEQRRELIRLLQASEEISPEWARVLFPPEKREYEHCPDEEQVYGNLTMLKQRTSKLAMLSPEQGSGVSVR